ncbi:MAG: hypothetical protein V1872_04770, partial [bacterium]
EFFFKKLSKHPLTYYIIKVTIIMLVTVFIFHTVNKATLNNGHIVDILVKNKHLYERYLKSDHQPKLIY